MKTSSLRIWSQLGFAAAFAFVSINPASAQEAEPTSLPGSDPKMMIFVEEGQESVDLIRLPNDHRMIAVFAAPGGKYRAFEVYSDGTRLVIGEEIADRELEELMELAESEEYPGSGVGGTFGPHGRGFLYRHNLNEDWGVSVSGVPLLGRDSRSAYAGATVSRTLSQDRWGRLYLLAGTGYEQRSNKYITDCDPVTNECTEEWNKESDVNLGFGIGLEGRIKSFGIALEFPMVYKMRNRNDATEYEFESFKPNVSVSAVWYYSKRGNRKSNR